MHSPPTVKVDRAGPVLQIQLNRPDVRNAIDNGTAALLNDHFDEFEYDRDLRVAVLSGCGTGFCSGMDLREFSASGDTPWSDERGLYALLRRRFAKPVVCAVEGFALAGGFELALACDLVVAARGSQFGLPEVKRGLVAAGGALRRLPQRLPGSVARELLLTGHTVGAERMHELGLVNEVVAPGAAVAVALEVATEIAANSASAVRLSRELLSAQQSWAEDYFWDHQLKMVEPIFASHDAREGSTAFIDKRDPIWEVC